MLRNTQACCIKFRRQTLEGFYVPRRGTVGEQRIWRQEILIVDEDRILFVAGKCDAGLARAGKGNGFQHPAGIARGGAHDLANRRITYPQKQGALCSGHAFQGLRFARVKHK